MVRVRVRFRVDFCCRWTWKDYTIGAAPPSYSSYFYLLTIYMPIATSRIEPESKPLMCSVKPLLPMRLTEYTESLSTDLVNVLQDKQYTSKSWISCSYKMCMKWSNMKQYQVLLILKISQTIIHSHALESHVTKC